MTFLSEEGPSPSTAPTPFTSTVPSPFLTEVLNTPLSSDKASYTYSCVSHVSPI